MLNVSFTNHSCGEQIWIYWDFPMNKAVPAPPGKNPTEISSHLGRDSGAPDRAIEGCSTFSSSPISTAACPLRCPSHTPSCDHCWGTVQSLLHHHCWPTNVVCAEKSSIWLRMPAKTASQKRVMGSGAGSHAAGLDKPLEDGQSCRVPPEPT